MDESGRRVPGRSLAERSRADIEQQLPTWFPFVGVGVAAAVVVYVAGSLFGAW